MATRTSKNRIASEPDLHLVLTGDQILGNGHAATKKGKPVRAGGAFVGDSNGDAKVAPKDEKVVIKRPNIVTAAFKIVGTAPYVQNKFSNRVLEEIHRKQAAGSVSKKGEKRAPKDFQALYEGSMHRMEDGSNGIPAPAFRSGMISACRTAGYAMTRAKLAIFVCADGFDSDGTPLIRFTKGKPEYFEIATRNDSGVMDLRARAKWPAGWCATVRIRFDADMFDLQSIANLLMRVGEQVGIGEGRPDSRNSCGMGWGLFDVVQE